MKIISTFTVVEESLFSVRYDNAAMNEWRRLFDMWNDPEQLHRFFSKHITDLECGFWGNITIEEAIHRTRREASVMEHKILELAELGKTSKSLNLSEFFVPLSKSETGKELEKDKGKGLEKHNWLRIYAIRIDKNVFVITGGAIKLTLEMNFRDHLLLELEKLELVRNFLQDGDNDLEFVELT